VNAVGKDSIITLSQRTLNLFPAVAYTYHLNRSKNLSIQYNGRTQQPTALQLQQVPDVTNPLQVRMGNPSLQQEFTNDLTLGYSSFSASSFRYLNVSVYLSQTANKITNSIDTVPPGVLGAGLSDKTVQFIKPVNADGVMSSYATITVGLPFRNSQGSSVDFTNTISYNRDVNEIFKAKNISSHFAASQAAGINLNVRDKLNLSLKGEITYNKIMYSIQKSLNTDYLSQTYTSDVSYYLSNRLLVYTDFTYTSNQGMDGFDFAASLWNATIACQLFKRRDGELKFSANDLLNQNRSFMRTVSEHYILSSKTTALQRYFMLSFTYNFRSTMNKKVSPAK
jgi:hypothetical protein